MNVVNIGIIDEAKKRASAMGVTYTSILTRAGISDGTVNEAYLRRRYRSVADAEGYDPEAYLGAMSDETINKYCIAFMLNPDDWTVKTPPKAKSLVSAATPVQDDIGAGVEDILVALADMAKVQHAILAELQKRESPIDLETANLFEGKAGTIIRLLEGIDNKSMATVTEVQRVSQKQDKSMKLLEKIEPKVKNINEMMAGVVGKVEQVRTVLDRIASR